MEQASAAAAACRYPVEGAVRFAGSVVPHFAWCEKHDKKAVVQVPEGSDG